MAYFGGRPASIAQSNSTSAIMPFLLPYLHNLCNGQRRQSMSIDRVINIIGGWEVRTRNLKLSSLELRLRPRHFVVGALDNITVQDPTCACACCM